MQRLICEALETCPQSVMGLVEETGCAEESVRKNLKRLQDEGLVDGERATTGRSAIIWRLCHE